MKDRTFTTNYLSFKSILGNKIEQMEITCERTDGKLVISKQMLYSNNSVRISNNYSLTLKYLSKILRAYSCTILHLENVTFQDKATFIQSQSGYQLFSDLKKIIIKNSDSCFELVSQTKSLEQVNYDMNPTYQKYLYRRGKRRFI